MRLEGKVALITGGSSGVGAGIARAFAAEGAVVVLCGRRREPLEEIVAELSDAGARAAAHAGDVADAGVCEAAVATCRERFGGLDVLVNNAGHYDPQPAAASDDAVWERTLGTNLHGPRRLAVAAQPALQASSAASVVNISSTLSLRPVPGCAAYCVSKAALDMLTRVLAVEWAGDGIRVNSILLGIVDTPIHEVRGIEDRQAWLGQVSGMHPIGRIGQPADAAAAAVFLASDEASWITGSLFTVDGGIHLA